MSLDTLRQLLLDAAKGGKILVRAATFTSAGLKAPEQLDERLGKAFVDCVGGAGVPITTTVAQIEPIQGNQFEVTGTIDVKIASKGQVRLRFGADGDQGRLVIGIDLGSSWSFGKSFPSLKGERFGQMGLKAPGFYFAGQPEAAYPWNKSTVRLEPGLNFAGQLALTGALESVADLLSGFIPAPSGYLLSGTIDPSQEVQTGPDGKKVYSFPGLQLATPNLADGSFTLGYLSIEAPHLLLTLVDYGDDVGKQPALMLASKLILPGGGDSPEFRTVLPTSKKVKLVGFTVVNPKGGLALSADQLFGLMAGQTWFGLVPPALSAYLQNFGFRSFGAMVSYGKGLKLANIQVVVGSGKPWVLIEDPKLALDFEVDWTILSPFQEGQSQFAQLTATAQFMPELFPGNFEFTINTDMLVSGGYTAKSEAEYVSFNALVDKITGGVIQIPEQFLDVKFQEFFVTVNQPARSFNMGATTSIKLPLLGEGTFELNDVALRLNVQKPQAGKKEQGLTLLASGAANDGTQYSGSISGNLVVGPLYLQALGKYAKQVWNFELAMQPGTKLGLQDLLHAVFDQVELPTDIFDVDLQIADVSLKAVVPTAKGKFSSYSGSGTIKWHLAIAGQSIDTTAKVALAYDGAQKPNAFTGSVSAETTFDLFGVGATFTVGYAIENDKATKKPSKAIFISWEGLTARYVQGEKQKVLEFTADSSWNLGRLIKAMVRLVSPASNRELPAPWNLLNNVSLAGLKISFDMESKKVTASWPLKLNLGFGQIESFDIIKKPGEQVQVTLKGKFAFIEGDSVAWDAVNEDPPEVPGGGDSAFDLRLLALGQHVTVPDLKSVQSIGDAVNQLAGFETPKPTARVIPVGPGIPKERALVVLADTPKPPLFSLESNWLIGAHFLAVSNTLEIKAIFNDPILYGLRINLAGAKAKVFAGLQFEILYKKVTDTIGMYKVMLQLPDAMRYLQFGQVTVILPVVGLEIYTNGNFKVDFGFPYNLDFSRSFTVQVFPFTGSGGFYFGVLNGATSSQVPENVTGGNFNPVIEFGLGLQVGLGKSFSAGILRAEIAVTVFGIVEGVIAVWNPYQKGNSLIEAPPAAMVLTGSADVGKAYYYKISGTLGIIGKVVGVVDFAIVKASLNLTVYAYIQGTFEAYRATMVVMEAGMRVALSLEINCGLFKITINLSFSARIRESFKLGEDHLQDAPWYAGRLYAPAQGMPLMEAVRLYALTPDFGPLKTPAAGPLPLDVFFMPHLSVATQGSPSKTGQAAVYSVNLFISNERRTQGAESYESFGRLVRDTFLWIASSFSGRSAKGTPADELKQPVSQAHMRAALEYLAANADGRSLTYGQIAANLAALFALQVQLPPAAASVDAAGAPNATAFPMPPELTLQAAYKGQTLADVDFNDWATADERYISDLQQRIQKLIAQMMDELSRKDPERRALRDLLRQDELAEQSIAQFVFTDYFAMACQALVQGAIDAFANYAYALKAGDSIGSIRTAFNKLETGGSRNALTDEQIAWANRAVPLTKELVLKIDQVPYRIQDRDTWGAIATSHGLDPAAMAEANADLPTVLIPGAAITINGQQRQVPNDGTIAATAALFGIAPCPFGKAIAAMADLLSPLTVITLNGLTHKTAAGETITGLADLYGIEVATLTPSIAGQADLFDRGAQPTILLPGLQVLKAADLWADIEGHEGVTHLSGMAARYLLSGLRLPTDGLHFKKPDHPMIQGKSSGLQALTGQQFPLPALTGYDSKSPLAITLANGRKLGWVTFVGQKDPSKFVFALPQEAADQVNGLLGVAKAQGLQAPIKPPQALDLLEERARRFTFRNNIILQTAVDLRLPHDRLPGGVTRRPRIWNFPAALLAELGRPVALDPCFAIQIGAANDPGGKMTERPAKAYGYGTLVNLSVKRIVAADGSKVVSPTTYELAGADEVGINLLERLLGHITPTDTKTIQGVYVLYQPNQSSDRAQGLQYDGEERYATFLVQSNLSTETNPPSDGPRLGASPEEEGPRGLLNSTYQFINRLWAGSIVRSGGYYFSYQLPDGSGLPDSLFNEESIAQIAVLILYRPADGIADAQGGELKSYMNVAVIDDPVDAANDVLFVESRARAASVVMKADRSLAGIAAQYHTGVIDIVAANAAHPLSESVSLTVTDIVHQVRRGETLEQILKQFSTTKDALQRANPHVDLGKLTAGTGLHIADLVIKPAGRTLTQIAEQYETSVAALAWANRMVKGLFTESPALTFDDRLVDKQSSLPPGNVGLTVVRKNPDKEVAQPALYLEKQYNMLGYDLVTNTDFVAIEGALALPATPASDEPEHGVAQPKLAAPLQASNDEDWTYTFVVPAARAARNRPKPEAGSQPDLTQTPYAGVGGFVQLALDWRDVLGNQTWSRFDDGAAGNAYPLNQPPIRVGFTDDVIGLGQWPSTRFDHYFTAGAQLKIAWSFEKSRYDKSKLPPDSPDAWYQNAEADRQVYANLYYQLMQTGPDGAYATVMETSTTMDGGEPRALSDSDAVAVRQYVLSAWRYIDQVIKNGGALPPDSQLPQPVEIARTVQTSSDAVITEVAASFRLRRQDVLVLADFRDADPSRVAVTAIGPRMQKEASGGYGLQWYTGQFQAAFDLPGYQYRLATGVPRGDAGNGQQRDTLWAVRLGKTPDQRYSYALKGSAPAYFAPAPLSTVLLNRPDVTLYNFTPDSGLSPSADEKQSFTGVDLDVWGRMALAGIDQLLSPQFAVPAFLVDKKGHTDYLQRVLDAKFALADAIVGGVTNILTQPPLDPVANKANFEAARQKLRQQLLMQLENTYAIDAIVQHEVSVTGPAGDPATAPRLYGNVVDPNQGPGAKEYSASAFKIPLAGGNSLLTYTFRTRDAGSQAHVPLKLEYRPTHIEHEIGGVPGVEEYQASSWLTFIDALPAIATANLDIPIPLRAYPTPPSLQSQSAVPADPQRDPNATLTKAKEWTYRFVFARPHAAQDRIDANVRFNVPLDAGFQGRLTAEQPDLFVMLARINLVLAAIEQIFATDLMKVGLDTDPADPLFKRAQQALGAFARLVAGEPGDGYGLADAWRGWVTSGSPLEAAPATTLPFAVAEDFINYEVKSGTTLKLLRVKIAYPKRLLPGMDSPPSVTFDGYAAHWVDPQDQPVLSAADGSRREDLRLNLRQGLADEELVYEAFIYEKVNPGPDDPPYLTWDQSRTMADRRVDLAGLDVIQYQNAWANLQIIRNLNLVGEQNPTRSPFVYRTPAVQFRNKLTPLLDNGSEIEIARVPSGAPEERKLADHLTALFTAFFKGSPSQEQLINLEVRYGYTLSEQSQGLAIELPVLLVPPTEFQIPPDWTEGQVPAARFVEALAGRIVGWYGMTRPATLHGHFRFDLSAFSSLTNNTQPLVRVRNLVLGVDEITDL